MQVVNLDITYTEAQWEVFFVATERFRVVQKGGRVGFTQGAAQAFTQLMLQSDKLKYFLWGDETLGNVRKYFEIYFRPILKQIGIEGKAWSFNRQDMELRLGKCVCHFRSADRPHKWEGFGYHYVFLNEAGLILRNAYIWEQAVQKTLLDHSDSIMIAAGVPKGINKFSEMIEWAKDPRKPQWRHFHFSTYENPFIEKKEIDRFVADSPITARQEIFGEVVGSEDNAFQFIMGEWVDDCFANWEADISNPNMKLPELTSIGGDPSGGGDECVLTFKHGPYVPQQHILEGEAASSTQKITNAWALAICSHAQRQRPKDVNVPIRIDFIGIGKGVYDLLKGSPHHFPNVIGLTGGAASIKKDHTKTYTAGNDVTWWWMLFGEMINPNSPNYRRISICPDPILKQQLCAVRYEVRNDKIYREKKDLTKARLNGKSPDRAESLIYAFCDKRGKPRFGIA